MANNLIQVKRTSVSGRAANSTTLPNPGELALNMTDGILYSTNGSTVFEIGANNTNATVTGTLTVNAVSANGGVGANNQRLTSNGSSAYWKDPLIKDLVDVAANGATDTQVLTYSSTLSKWINQNPPVANVVYTTGYYGVFYDTTIAQYATGGSNTATVTKIANTLISNGLTRTANDEMQVTYAGVYQIQYSLQFNSTSNKNEVIYVWLRKNGTDVPDTGTDFGIYPVAGGANGYIVAVTPLVDIANAGDKYQIMWATSSNSAVSMITQANTTFAPQTPAAIVSVIPISNIITAPPGTNTDVTFNDSGLANGAAGLTYNKTTNSVSVANNLFVGNTVNAASFTVNGTFWANSTSVNSATFQVGSDFTANSTLVNAAAIYIRGSATVNSTLTLNDGLSANGGLGTTGQVLFTDGSKAYWNTIAIAASVNADAQYVWTNTHTFQNTITFGNSTVNSTVNSTFFTGTANNTSFVGSVSAANVVSNAQLSGNLSNYQTTAGLAANVATLTSNNATHAFGKTEGNLNVNSAVYATSANNSTYVYGKVEGDLNVNSAVYANNSTYAYGKTEGNLNVNNATYAYGKTEGNLNVNSAVYANNSTYAYGKTEGNLNVNSAVHANNSSYAFGKTENNLNVNSAVYANDASYLNSKTESNLNVNNALTANYASYVTANTGVVSNSSGVFVNSAYIATLDANNASYLGMVAAASYVQNTESRILSGNLNFTGTNNFFTTAVYVNNAVINSGGVYAPSLYGNLTGNVVATTISGNLTGNVSATSISGNLTGNVSATIVNASSIGVSGNVTVGSNVSLNTSVLAIGNSTANVYVNTTAFVGNVVATSISGNLTGNVSATTLTGNLTGNVSATTLSGNLTAITANVTNKLQIGTPGSFDFGSNAVIEIDANGNTYVQSVIQNANTGNNASADLVVTNDTGNDSFNYVDLGINGSQYDQAGFSITGANDAYLYASDGHLAIGTASDKEVIFHAGGTTASDRRFTVNSTAIAIANEAALIANGSTGTAGHVLHSNSTGVYWAADDSGVTSVASGNGITGGTITGTGTLYVTQGTGIVVNTSGVHVNSAYINTISANSATYLGDSGNFGNSTGIYTTGLVNATTVNATTLQTGAGFSANASQVVAADLLVTGNLVVNGTTVTLNTATLDVKDLNITLAKGTASAAAASGAGITVDGANATLTYINASNTWLSNINFTVGNTVSNVSVNSTAFIGNVIATALSGNLTGNVAAVSISGNLTGNVIATTISGNLTGNVVATTVNASTINATSNVIVGANVTIDTAKASFGTISTTNAPQVIVANTSGTTTINANFISTTSITGNLTGNVVATTITGNLTGNVAATTITGNLTGNVSATTITSSGTLAAGNTTITGFANISGNVIVGSTSTGGSKLSIGSAPISSSTFKVNTDITIDSNYDATDIDFYVQNTALTAARVYRAEATTISNRSQNKDSGGTDLGSDMYGKWIILTNGAEASAAVDARIDSALGAFYDVRNYSSGATSNTIDVAYGVQAAVRTFAGGNITTAYGFRSIVYPATANATVTGNVGAAFAYSGVIGLNSGNASVGTGYLYHGTYNTSANVTGVKYGLYLTNETTNYISGNVGIGNVAPTHKLRVEGATSLAGAVSNITTLAAGNTTITGFANVSGNGYFGANVVIDTAKASFGTAATTNAPQVIVANTSGTTTVNAGIVSTTTLNATTVNANTSGATVSATANVSSNTIFATNAFAVSTAFTANSTVVNAVSYYSGTLLVANTTVVNATHLGGVALANIARTDTADTFNGIITFNSNVVITELLSANSSFGLTNQFLRTGVTTNTYWGSLTSSDVTGALGYTPGTGTVTSVAAGTGLTSTGTTAVTISMPATGPGAGSYSGGISAITIDAQGRITAITGSAGYSTGDITGITTAVGSGLTGGVTSGTATLAVNGAEVLFLNDPGPLTAGLRINGSGLGVATGIPLAGEIAASGDITAFSSDARFKKDIEPIRDALEKLKKITGITYNHNALAKSLGLATGTRMAGVLAQEVEAVLPEVVTLAPLDTDYDEEGNKYSISGENYKTVKYDKMIPLLIEAIKELSEQVSDLKKRLGE